MKKIILLVSFILCVMFSFSQTPYSPVPQGNANQMYNFNGAVRGIRGFVLPVADTANNPATTFLGALTVLPGDVGKDTIPIWMSNSVKWIRFSGGNGTNINDTIYTRAPVAVDRTTIPGKQIIYLLHLDGIVSPGYVVWTGMGLNFNVTPADYYINYRQFFSSAALLTLAPAPVSNSRVDLFIVDTTANALVLTGTPGLAAAAPQTNPSSQLPLTTVTVNVGDTVPAGIALETIYNDHIAPPTEWLPTSNGSISADFDNTVNTYIGTKAIYVSSYANGSNITFTKGSGVDTVKAGQIIRGFVSFNIPFASQFQFQWFNGTTAVSNSIAINSGYGINPNNINNYQIFAIPLNAWNFTPASRGIYNKLVITMGGNDISGAGGFYMDYLQLQTGLINSTSDDFLDSVYLRNDSLFQYKHGIEYFRGQATGGGGGGSSLANFYLKDSSLSSDRDVDMNGKTLTFEQNSNVLLYLQPTVNDEYVRLQAFDETDDDNFARITNTTTDTQSQFYIESAFNGSVNSNSIRGYSDASESEIEYIAREHSFSGTNFNVALEDNGQVDFHVGNSGVTQYLQDSSSIGFGYGNDGGVNNSLLINQDGNTFTGYTGVGATPTALFQVTDPISSQVYADISPTDSHSFIASWDIGGAANGIIATVSTIGNTRSYIQSTETSVTVPTVETNGTNNQIVLQIVGADAAHVGTIHFQDSSLFYAANGYIWTLINKDDGRGAWQQTNSQGVYASVRPANTTATFNTTTDYTINCTSGTFTVNLPTATGIENRIYVVKNSGIGVITLDGNGTEPIDGSLTQVVAAGKAMTVQSIGTGWIILTQ